MQFSFAPSPISELKVSRYEPWDFPQFRVIFETSPDDSLGFLSQPPGEATTAIVIENCSSKDITALRYLWTTTDAKGQTRTARVSSDSYMVDAFRPVLATADRMLVSKAGSVTESILQHVQSGGGMLGGRSSGYSGHDEIATLHFEIDTIVFADGELAGPDATKFSVELNCRKPAAEFVARHVRLAQKEGRDPTPVLKALAEIPHLKEDFLARWTQRFASDLLRHLSREEWREAQLAHLENRPQMPEFYRREDKSSS